MPVWNVSRAPHARPSTSFGHDRLNGVASTLHGLLFVIVRCRWERIMSRPGRPRNHNPVADDINWAIRSKDDERAKHLILAYDIDILDGEASTPLICAACHDRPQLLRWLIDRGANVDHQDRNGFCALHYVAEQKNEPIAQILLSTGDQQRYRICTAIHPFGRHPSMLVAIFALLNC